MIVANHVSWIDIFLISSVRPTRFVAKSEIRGWPLAGWIAERAGTLFIRRDQMRDMARIDARVREVLAEGDCVGLFPEGITTEGDELRKFHSSLFEPAVANGAHVHPAAIRYEHPTARSAARCRSSASAPSWNRSGSSCASAGARAHHVRRSRGDRGRRATRRGQACGRRGR
jgi:1-acyl-sn-glycerol-3-phosphate acyltransferase